MTKLLRTTVFVWEAGDGMNDRKYSEEEYLQIAEIQHFAFCPRQWALDYLEGQWQENVLTIEGHALHDKAHDPMSREKRKGKIIVRGMRVFQRLWVFPVIVISWNFIKRRTVSLFLLLREPTR